jgi:hypothetical protein
MKGVAGKREIFEGENKESGKGGGKRNRANELIGISPIMDSWRERMPMRS